MYTPTYCGERWSQRYEIKPSFLGRPVLAAGMRSSAVARVVWQRGAVYKLWQEMTEKSSETLAAKRKV